MDKVHMYMIIMDAMSTFSEVCRPLADLECEKAQMVNRTQKILKISWIRLSLFAPSQSVTRVPNIRLHSPRLIFNPL